MPPLTISSVVGAGSDLIPALERLAPHGQHWLDGTGYADDIELRVAAPGGDQVTRTYSGRSTLLRLAGPLGGPYAVIAVRASTAGLEMIGGELVRARSAGVTLAFHPSTTNSSTTAASVSDEAAQVPVVQVPVAQVPVAPRVLVTAPPVVALPAVAPVEPVAASAAPSGFVAAAIPPRPQWARAAAASAAAASDSDEEGEQFPDAGDLVHHFAFGLSEVLMSDGDRLRIRDIKDPGRVREVAVSMLKVSAPTIEEGKRVFRLSRRGS